MGAGLQDDSGTRAGSGWVQKQIADVIGDPHERAKGLGVTEVADVQFHIGCNRDAHPPLTPGHSRYVLAGDCGLEMAEQTIECRR
jgi:hypothetical protein